VADVGDDPRRGGRIGPDAPIVVAVDDTLFKR